MKKFTKFLPIAFGVLALASCSSDDFLSNDSKEALKAGKNEMIAVVSDDAQAITRYGLDNSTTMFVWSTGDTYTVFDQTLTKYSEYDLDPAYSGSKAGLFAVKAGQSDIVDAEGNSTARYGVFPYAATNEISLKNHVATLYMELPSELAYSAITNGENGDLPEDGGAVAALPLWGSVKGTAAGRKITFKMMTGMLKIDLSEIPANYSKNDAPKTPAYLIVKSAAHKLSGKFKADITDQTNAEFSGDAADVQLVLNTAKGSETNDDQVKVTFSTEGKKINRVFYVPIPAGTYEAGDLTVKLYDHNDAVKADLTPDTWKADAVTIARGKAKKITFTVEKEVAANSIQGINNVIYNELVIANSKSAIQEGQTFTFDVNGAALAPGAAATAGSDNMLLIPTFQDKNINVILNIQNDINLANPLYIAEAAFGTKSESTDNLYHTNTAANHSSVTDAVDASKRTITINFSGTITAGAVNILAPTSTVIINNAKAADQGFTNVAATVATGENTLQIGMVGTNAIQATGDLNIYNGGLYLGEKAAITNTKVNCNGNVNVVGGNAGTITKTGSGALDVDNTSTVAALTNSGTGAVTVASGITGALTNSADATLEVQAVGGNVNNTGASANLTIGGAIGGTVTNSGASATLEMNGAVTGAITNTGASANLTLNAAATADLATNSSQALVITKLGSVGGNLTSTGSGELQIHGTVTGAINNNGTAAISVSQTDKTAQPSVGVINQSATGGAINVAASSTAVTVNNKSKSSAIVIDYQYLDGAGATKKDAALATTITDDHEVMTNAATGSITVKNTTGKVDIDNLGGSVTLENCGDIAVPVNEIDYDTKTTPTITLTNSYVATINNNGSKKVTINTSGKAGIGTVALGEFTIVDGGWSMADINNANVETRNAGKIYTAAQLAGLTSTAPTTATVTLEADLTMSAVNNKWTGILEGATMTDFDGQNHTITGLKLKDQNDNGLFKSVTKALHIKNLTLDGFTANFNKSNVAALIGKAAPAAAANTLQITNVTVTGANLNISTGNSAAALVGSFISAAGQAADLTITGCDVTGTSTFAAGSYLAAFVGQLGLAKNVTINSSSIDATTLTVNGTPAKAVAGTTAYIVGGVSGAVTALTINTNCSVEPATLSNTQRESWKYKNNADNDGKFFWGADNGFVGYLNGGAITTYKIGTVAQIVGDENDYNIYKGY